MQRSLPAPSQLSLWDKADSIPNLDDIIGYDQANLSALPLTRTSSRDSRHKIETEWTAIGRDGETHDFYRTIYNKSGDALPGPVGDRLLMGLLALTPYRGEKGEVITHYNELGNIAGFDQKSGRWNRIIDRELGRLHNIGIQTNSFWMAQTKSYAAYSEISLLAAHHIDDTDEEGRKKIRVSWTSEFLQMLRDWTKPLNLPLVMNLSSPVARRLYRISELALYQGGCFQEDLKQLCHVYLGISENRTYPSQLKQSLRRSAEELADKDILHVSITEDPDRPSGHSVIVEPGSAVTQLNHLVEDDQYWAMQLMLRGVFDQTPDPIGRCRTLVEREGRPSVRRALSAFDRRVGSSVHSPGWIVKAARGAADTTRPSASQRGRSSADTIDELARRAKMDEQVSQDALDQKARERMQSEVQFDVWSSGAEDGMLFETVYRRELAIVYLACDHRSAVPEDLQADARRHDLIESPQDRSG